MTKLSWNNIRDMLAEEISNGSIKHGEQLPTELELVERFGVGRHSIRRAVEALAKAGKLSVEQGRGTFIEATPKLSYAIGKRTRLRKNLLPQDCIVTSELLGADLIVAPEQVRKALDLPDGAEVIESRRVTLANDLPIAFGSIFHCGDRFRDIVERRDLLGSMTETYKSYGIDDYLRGETELHVRSARAEEASILKQHPDMPVIVVRSIDTELNGAPIACSRVIWSSARVKFSVINQEKNAEDD